MKKKICIASIIVFPPNINGDLKANLLAQIKMMLTFLSHYQDKVKTIIVSNEKLIISNITKNIFDYKNFEVLEIKNKDLNFCNNAKWTVTKYHFAKLDSLQLLNNYFEENRKYNKLIISDIDSIFLDIQRLINISNNIQSIAAINYRDEKNINYTFDEMMTKAIRSCWPDFFSNKKLAWINSGFMIIDINYLPKIIQSSQLIFEWVNKNINYVRNVSDNHYGDETIFSAVFNKFNGKVLNNKSSKVARFFWTCQTKKINKKAISFLNPIIYPSHIHLPAIKYSDQYHRMSILTKLGTIKRLNFIVILLLNYWRFKSIVKFFLIKSFIYRIYKKSKTIFF